MTDVNGSNRESDAAPATPFDTSADSLGANSLGSDALRSDALTGDAPGEPTTPADPEARAFAGGTAKPGRPLKDAAQDLRENGEALFAAGMEAGRARAEDARRWAELKREETAERIRDEPMKAVGMAFGVGLIAGLLLRRR